MMLTLLKKELKERRWYFVIPSGFLLVAALSLPYMYRNLFPILYLSNNFTFADFVWGSWWGQPVWQMGYVFVFFLGSNILGKERELGILEFLLSRNISKGKVLASKIIVDLSIIAAVIVLTTIVMLISVNYSSIEYNNNYSNLNVAIFLWIALCGAYLFCGLLTLLTRARWKGFTLGLLWVVIDLIIYTYSQGTFSLTRYMIDSSIYMNNGFPLIPAIVVVVAGGGIIKLTYDIFSKYY